MVAIRARRVVEASSVIRSRASFWKSVVAAARRREGEARIGFTRARRPWRPRGPNNGVPIAPRATPSHSTVVRYADLDLRRLNHSPSHATPLGYERTNDRLPPNVGDRWAYEANPCFTENPPASAVTSASYELDKVQRCYLHR